MPRLNPSPPPSHTTIILLHFLRGTHSLYYNLVLSTQKRGALWNKEWERERERVEKRVSIEQLAPIDSWKFITQFSSKLNWYSANKYKACVGGGEWDKEQEWERAERESAGLQFSKWIWRWPSKGKRPVYCFYIYLYLCTRRKATKRNNLCIPLKSAKIPLSSHPFCLLASLLLFFETRFTHRIVGPWIICCKQKIVSTLLALHSKVCLRSEAFKFYLNNHQVAQ